jgi:hypothetical protein
MNELELEKYKKMKSYEKKHYLERGMDNLMWWYLLVVLSVAIMLVSTAKGNTPLASIMLASIGLFLFFMGHFTGFIPLKKKIDKAIENL